MRPASVTLKLATSLDGKIATAGGESRWITGEAARAEVHRLRALHDAVLVGVATALTDDPELTARGEPRPPRQPLRIVLDSELRLPVSSRLAQSTGVAPVLVCCSARAPEDREGALRRTGVDVRRIEEGDGGLSVSAVLALPALSGGSVLVEGGGRVAAAFLRAGLVDRIEWFRAPMVIGAEGRDAVGEMAHTALRQAPRFRRVAIREVGADIWETLERGE